MHNQYQQHINGITTNILVFEFIFAIFTSVYYCGVFFATKIYI